MRFFIFISIYF